MCLVSKRRFPKKAKKDIICYKLLEKFEEKYYTPCRGIYVDINKELKAKGISLSIIEPYEKGEGYIHSFRTLPHRDALESSGWNLSRISIFKCIIPKGTKYHIGNNYDICSKKIIFKKLICSYQYNR